MLKEAGLGQRDLGLRHEVNTELATRDDDIALLASVLLRVARDDLTYEEHRRLSALAGRG